MGTFGGAQPIVTDGLVFAVDAANYESYTSGSTTWSDLAGNNNGTLINGPTFDSGNGGSIVFDGTNDRVDIGYTPEGQSSITICSWFKTTRTTRQVLVGAYSGTSGNTNAFAINLNRGSSLNEQDSVLYFARIGTGTSNTQSSYATSTSLSNGNWHFLTVTHDLPTGTAVINMDGTDYSVTDTASSSSGPWGLFEFDSMIGANNIEGTAGVFVDGQVSCMSIYNRVLSSSEILQNYNALKGRFGL